MKSRALIFHAKQVTLEFAPDRKVMLRVDHHKLSNAVQLLAEALDVHLFLQIETRPAVPYSNVRIREVTMTPVAEG